MAKLGRLEISEAVRVPNDAPYEQISWATVRSNVFGERNCTTALGHPTPRWQDDATFCFWEVEILSFPVGAEYMSNAPSNVMCRQIPGIDYLDMSYTVRTILESVDTAWLNINVGALENSGVNFLPLGGSLCCVPKVARREPQPNCRKSQNDSESSNKFMLIRAQELPNTSNNESERTTKKGAIIFFTAVIGLVVVYLLAGRQP
jgi:hypothetical protein